MDNPLPQSQSTQQDTNRRMTKSYSRVSSILTSTPDPQNSDSIPTFQHQTGKSAITQTQTEHPYEQLNTNNSTHLSVHSHISANDDQSCGEMYDDEILGSISTKVTTQQVKVNYTST